MSTPSQRLVTTASGLLERRLSRRGFFARAAVVGSAVTTSGFDYLLRPGTAYASVCGQQHTCSSGWTAMCCSIAGGVNQCPPGSFPGGWWKADGASLCGGHPRYYVDCQADCTHCRCHGSHFCGESCWSCRPHCSKGGCDERRVCHNVFRYGQCERERSCSGPVLCRAISCTPPWKWANCSTTAATDDFTVSHNAPCLPHWTPIQQRYTELGSQASVLGTTVNAEERHAHGHIQRYVHGRMYWSAHTGAHYLTGAVLRRYIDLGELDSPLGRPVSDISPTRDSAGVHARFEHGGISNGPHTHAHALWGDIWRKWDQLGGAVGPLGYPTTDLSTTTTRNGDVAHFTAGAIYQQHGYPPHAVYSTIEVHYRALGAQDSALGFPVADEAVTTDQRGVGGVELVCENGAMARGDGQSIHVVTGPIYATWDAEGRAQGPLGFPTSDVEPVTLADGPGQQCTFEYGMATYDGKTGQVTVTLTPSP